MTVLSRYERLECAGIWRDAAEAQRRNVFVSMGKSTLIIKDATDVALTHWSLPAIERINPGRMPAIYRPGLDSEEELEIDDATMIEAIGTVQRAVARARPQPGRLRRSVFAMILAAVLALAVLWLPGALVRHTAAALPEATRTGIGARLLHDLEPVAGRPCHAPQAERALAVMKERLFGGEDWRILVLPGGPARTAHLPGGILLVNRGLIEGQATPEVAAGALLAEAERARASDPLADLLSKAGPLPTFWLLTSGEIAEERLADYAGTLLVDPPDAVDQTALRARFAQARISSAPYAAHADDGAELLRRDDPYPDGTPEPILSDAAWLRLQSVCGD